MACINTRPSCIACYKQFWNDIAKPSDTKYDLISQILLFFAVVFKAEKLNELKTHNNDVIAMHYFSIWSTNTISNTI